ncbi:MAG: DNA cytosine methyltransferase [Acidobacteria bacterium]|nr:DNA cytosine methyltransferase [Acidobacteriota bacterium]MBI3422351.1 DNA cytosine methyltransferase [Acidobacteriota bacterium]
MLDYVAKLNDSLKPNRDLNLTVIDLFAGCGGLALGFESAGFETIGFERDPDAARTYAENLLGDCHQVELTLTTEYPPAQVIIGGPPCQPFSVGGYQLGMADGRNGFPVFLEAVKRLKPELCLFENVRGLLYSNKWYFDEIVRALAQLGYLIDYKLMNAVDYGVPQNRERLFVVAHKGNFSFPRREARRYTVTEAIEDLMYTTPPESKFLTPSMDQYVKKYEIASKCINPRDLYPDKPARTLTCRNIAAPTGDMQRIKLPDGRRRRLLLREAARLQSFPDWFEFTGNEARQFYQIGNAVPPVLAQHLAQSVKDYFSASASLMRTELSDAQLSINDQMSLFPYERLFPAQ